MSATVSDAAAAEAAEIFHSLCSQAREDCALFCEMILRDEQTQEPVEMRPMHAEWHEKAATGTNMVIWAHPASGKSQCISIGYTLWRLGRNPRTRVGLLAAAEKQSKKLLSSIKDHIENNEVLHAIFPELRRGAKWSEVEIIIKREGNVKDPSVQVISPNGEIQGARLDLLVIDDILVENNTRTAYQREKLSTWVRSGPFSRMEPGGQIIFLANAFHPEDMAHELAKAKGWWAKKYPVRTKDGELSWPEKWPESRIQEYLNTMGATECARMLFCEPRADADARFNIDNIEKAMLRGLDTPVFNSLREFVEFYGAEFWAAKKVHWKLADAETPLWVDQAARGIPEVDRVVTPYTFPSGFQVYTGVDLAVSKEAASDYNCIFSIMVWPDGTRQVLRVRYGKWSAPVIVKNIVDEFRAFRGLCIVETVAAQDFVRQWVLEDHPGVVVKGFKTNATKRHREFGVEGIATEMERGLWLIPSFEEVDDNDNVVISTEDAITAWRREMEYYSPDGHTGDGLMAAWFARSGAKAYSDSAATNTNGEAPSAFVIGGKRIG